MRFTPVMLALLLALSPGAVALQASAPTAQASEPLDDEPQSATERNTSTVMTLGTDPARTAFDTPSLSLGTSLSMERDRVRSKLSAKSLKRQIQAADTVEDRKQILNRYRFRIENHIISLKARERQATQAFSNGTISKSQYLRTLGFIDAEVERVHRAVNVLKRQAGRTKFSFYDRSLKKKVVALEGPVRDQIAKALQGETEPMRVYVATTADGVVLATVTNGHYVREVYRVANRDPSANGQISIAKAYEKVVRPQFPWATDEDNKVSRAKRRYPAINILRFRYTHPHGNLTAYVDRGTEEIYYTIQHKRLTGNTPLPTGLGVSNASENLTVAVNRTYAGGPLRVKVTNATGAPVQAEITVGGEVVGRTNPNGILWTLGPAERFRVSATHDFRTVNVTATPVEQ